MCLAALSRARQSPFTVTGTPLGSGEVVRWASWVRGVSAGVRRVGALDAPEGGVDNSREICCDRLSSCNVHIRRLQAGLKAGLEESNPWGMV